MNVQKVSAMIGERELTIEIGKLAKQAHGSALVRYGDTVVLVTACAADKPREGIDFFPLTVDYRENFTPPAKFPADSSNAKENPPNAKYSTAA
jgi:polyribonucleotide nucleotidyltransferase